MSQILIDVTQDNNTSTINILEYINGDVEAFKEFVCQEFGLDPQEHEQNVEKLFDSIKDGLLFEVFTNNQPIDLSEIEMFIEHSFNDETEAEAFWLYAQNNGNGTSDKTNFQNAYQGVHAITDDFAEQLAKNCGWIDEDTPSQILKYIDFDHMWYDMLSQDYFSLCMDDGKEAIFRNV